MAKRPERSLGGFAGVRLGFRGGFAGVRLGFRFSTELQTAARKTQPKRSQLNRGGTSAPLDDELGQLEVRVGFGIGNKRLT